MFTNILKKNFQVIVVDCRFNQGDKDKYEDFLENVKINLLEYGNLLESEFSNQLKEKRKHFIVTLISIESQLETIIPPQSFELSMWHKKIKEWKIKFSKKESGHKKMLDALQSIKKMISHLKNSFPNYQFEPKMDFLSEHFTEALEVVKIEEEMDRIGKQMKEFHLNLLCFPLSLQLEFDNSDLEKMKLFVLKSGQWKNCKVDRLSTCILILFFV